MEANLLPPVLKLLYQEFPLLRPAIRLIPFSSLLDLVENGQLQAALSIKEEQNRASLSFRELCSAPICCICSPEHPLAAYEALKKKPLSGNLIACAPRQIPDAVLTIQNSILANLPPDQRIFTENIESALILAKAGLGYTIYPDIPGAREPGLRYIPVESLPTVSFGVYYPQAEGHPVLKRFLGLIGQNSAL